MQEQIATGMMYKPIKEKQIVDENNPVVMELVNDLHFKLSESLEAARRFDTLQQCVAYLSSDKAKTKQEPVVTCENKYDNNYHYRSYIKFCARCRAKKLEPGQLASCKLVCAHTHSMHSLLSICSYLLVLLFFLINFDLIIIITPINLNREEAIVIHCDCDAEDRFLDLDALGQVLQYLSKNLRRKYTIYENKCPIYRLSWN